MSEKISAAKPASLLNIGNNSEDFAVDGGIPFAKAYEPPVIEEQQQAVAPTPRAPLPTTDPLAAYEKDFGVEQKEIESPISYHEEVSRDEEAISSSYSFGKSLNTAAREVIPGYREIVDGRPVFDSLEFDEDPNFDHNSQDAQDIYAELGEEYYGDLNDAKSLSEMMNTRDQINAANDDMQYMNSNHGIVGSMGLYMVASLADPASYVGYGLLTRAYRIAKIAEKMSTMSSAGRAGITAGAAAGIEGSSEYYIQSHGAREYSQVGATMMFAAVLGGGGHFMLDTLKANHSVKQQEAFDQLTTGGVTLKAEPERAKELLDIALADDMLSAYRSKLAKHLSKLLPKRLQFSPGYLAWQKGGSISALAHLFDTLPGLSTKGEFSYKAGDNNIFEPKLRDGRTAMDIKYEAMEDFVQYEHARIESYRKHVDTAKENGVKPLTKEQFSTAVWTEVNKNFQRYQTKKMSIIGEIENDKILVEELRAGLNDKLINDPDYLKLEGMREKEAYRDEQLISEIDVVARERMKTEPEYMVAGRDEPINDMVEASSKYYANMQARLEKSGIKGAEYYDPRFHMPRMYNKDKIKADMDGAKGAMAKAIEDSAEYKHDLAKAQTELEEAIVASKNSKDEGIVEEIAAIERNIEYATQELKDIEKMLSDPAIPEAVKANIISRKLQMTKNLANGSMKLMIAADGETMLIQFPMVRGEVAYGKIVRGQLQNSSKAEYDTAASAPRSREQVKSAMDSIDGARVHNEPEIRAAVKKAIADNEAIELLMKSTGMTMDDIVGALPDKAWSSSTGRIGISENAIDNQVVIHELLHNLTTEALATSPAFRKEIVTLRDSVIDGYYKKGGLQDVLESHGIDFLMPVGKGEIQVGDRSVAHVFDDGTTIGHRVAYMLGLDEAGVPQERLLGEFISVGLSNPILAKVLNEIKVKDTVTGKNITILTKMRRALQKYLGVKRLNKDSVFGQMFASIEKQASSIDPAVIKAKKTKNEYLTIESAIKAKERELEAIEWKDAKNDAELEIINRTRDKLMGDIEFLGKQSVKKRDEIVTGLKKQREDVEKSMGEGIETLKEKQKAKTEELSKDVETKTKELRRLKSYPKKAADASIENISKATTLEQFGLASNTPPVLRGRKLNLDPNSMHRYMQTDEASISQVYHYGTSGRMAVGHATGFTDPAKFRSHLEAKSTFDKEDMQVAMDLFELTLGTRQIPHDAGSNWEQGIRMMKSFNYVTMGGQFAKYGMSEIGAGVYATGFGYLKNLIPALSTTTKMYKGKQLTNMESDLIRISEASEIWQNNARTKYADIDNIESTFASGAEEKVNWMSQAMFRISGLEGISTLTKIALPRAFLGRIIKQAEQGRSSYDLTRWGIGIEDMDAISKQPYVTNEKGVITDFNFSAWDKGVADKFQLATTRMSRDGILRPDSIRIPNWVNDGGSAWIWRLAGQFMSFAMMANERLFLRGLSENRRMALVGAMTSMGILAAFEKGSEEAAIALGVMKEEDARYGEENENGTANLLKAVATRGSFVGAPHFLAEQLMNYNSFNGSDRVLSQAGGPTAGRFMTMARAAKEFGWDGKVGTSAQIHTMKSSIPFNNLLMVDSFVRNIGKDLKREAKSRDYYQSDVTGIKEIIGE